MQIRHCSTDRRIYALEELKSELDGLLTDQGQPKVVSYHIMIGLLWLSEEDIWDALRYLDPEPRDLWMRVGHW